MNFEMANSDNPEEIILATQRSLLDSMLKVLGEIKGIANPTIQPGLTWDQIEYFLKSFREKAPTIIHQAEPL